MNADHADLATLVAYRLGELDPASEAALEEHYFACGDCTARLAEIEALAEGVRAAFDSGRVAAFFPPSFIESLRARGVRLREYRVPCNGAVNCAAAPGDQVLVGRLDVALEGISRIDAVVVHEGEHRHEDIPFDAASGTVIVSPSIRHLRTMPAHTQVVRLVAVEPGGDRVLGEYTFNHSPHPE